MVYRKDIHPGSKYYNLNPNGLSEFKMTFFLCTNPSLGTLTTQNSAFNYSIKTLIINLEHKKDKSRKPKFFFYIRIIMSVAEHESGAL